MGNPFAITSEELLKRQQGIQGPGETDQSQNTPEAREAKETEKLKSTDVYSAATQRGGSMATTDGVFENYDGFTRSTTGTPVATQPESKEEKDGKSLLDKTFGATGEANTQKGNCKDYQEVASDDTNFVNKQVNKQKQGVTRLNGEINNMVTQKETLRAENDALSSEVDSLNDEISTLMAEDGQTYTPQEIPQEAPAPAAAQGNDNAGAGNGAMTTPTTADGATATAGGGMSMGGGMSVGGGAAGGQAFAMNSLPSDGGQTAAPTSETAVSAQNNQAAQDAGQTNNNKQNQQQQQGANQNAATRSASGNSLKSFGGSLVQGKGKNADRINELLGQVSSKTSAISSNNGTISSLTTSGNTKATTFQTQLKAIMNQTVNKKATNTDNHDGAQTAQMVGSMTTATGGLATATGASMLALSWGSNQLGTYLMAGGGVATAAGTATTTIGQATSGDTQGAINTAANGINALTGNLTQVTQAKQLINDQNGQKKTPDTPKQS